MHVLDRRDALRLGGLATFGALLAGCGTEHAPSADAETPHAESSSEAVTAETALARLKYGNARFVGGNATRPRQDTERRGELAAGQHPHATILSCVDSRVPPEIVFDHGLGDLFVIRTAGQVVDHAVLGSIQYGVHELHIPLLVVMGHTKCGAVKATVEAVEKNSPASGTDIDALVTAIKPAVEEAKGDNPADLVDASITKNVSAIVSRLSKATVLADAIADKHLAVVGAKYDLATGAVTFLDT
jgi:carbonic anhydrase